MTGERIAIIGGGVVGITAAALLQANGYPTVLYAVAQPADFPRDPPALFASLHAAASILPHSIGSPDSTRWTAYSLEYFRALAFCAQCGVRAQRHYEIFEDDAVQPPPYSDVVANFEMLTTAQLRGRLAPVRREADAATGWCFSTFFCEAPIYLRYLYELYRAIGGEVTPAPLMPEPPSLQEFSARSHAVCVLCAGQASPALLADVVESGGYTDRPADGVFEPLADPFGVRLIRGHYLLLDLHRPLYDADHRTFSYNYTPSPDIYPAAIGAADIYCYPRSVGWLLGGSRQVGQIDRHGVWHGEVSASDELSFPGYDGAIQIPAPIFRLNRELLASTGRPTVDLDSLRYAKPGRITAGIGYRYVRDSDDDSVRVGVSRIARGDDEMLVVHNYGHGGAGYTLSWGCALDVLRVVARMAEPMPSAEPAGSDHELTRRAIVAVTEDLLGDL